MEYEVEGAMPRSRPKKTWRDIVKKDCEACTCKLNTCEWVNVSSGTGSLGLSRTKSRSTTMTTTTTTNVLRPPGLCPGLPGCAGTRKVKPVWIYWSKR